MNTNSNIWNVVGWLFGAIVFAIGTLNLFWGNDPGFGIFLILLSFAYYPPVNALIKRNIGWSVPAILKVCLGVFILWASLGVGELFDKVDMMMRDLG